MEEMLTTLDTISPKTRLYVDVKIKLLKNICPDVRFDLSLFSRRIPVPGLEEYTGDSAPDSIRLMMRSREYKIALYEERRFSELDDLPDAVVYAGAGKSLKKHFDQLREKGLISSKFAGFALHCLNEVKF